MRSKRHSDSAIIEQSSLCFNSGDDKMYEWGWGQAECRKTLPPLALRRSLQVKPRMLVCGLDQVLMHEVYQRGLG